MDAVRQGADKQDRVQVYQRQLSQLQELRTLYNQTAAASGQWNTQTVRTLSATESFTNKIRQQKLGLGELTRSFHLFNEAAKEQVALRNSMSTQFSGNMFGKQNIDLHTPKNLGRELDMARAKYGLINQAIAAAAHQTVNWGKNTQWAGRQIAVGLSVPLGIAAVGAAALALEVDKNLTRVAKVYDTVATDAAGQEVELAELRQNSLRLSTDMAQQYGAAMQDVLDIEAQLASSGLNGRDLMSATAEATRIATLGELDYQQAIDMTIALQTAFGLSNKELTESFNFMNSVENATSLSIQDIAEATPRAASALAALGGTVQDMTVMLVAMRESGVDAAEGANAIKSATSRLLNPTAAAVSYFSDTFGIDLKSVVDAAGGNIYKIMQDLAGLTNGYDELAKQRGIQELFGTYQFNRVTALWDNLGDAMTGTMNQTAQAMQVAGQSTGEWADVAATEIDRWQNSTQGKFKTAVEGIKAALVPLGMTVLEFVTPIMGFISGIIEGFNDLSKPLQSIILGGLAIAGIVGPILMLVGIMANLFGNIIKVSTSIANLRFRFKALSAQEVAAALQQKNMTSAFNTEAQSAAFLGSQIANLTRQMEMNAVAAGTMARANQNGTFTLGSNTIARSVLNQDIYTTGSRRGQVITRADQILIDQARQGTNQIANNAERTRKSFGLAGKAAGALGVASIGMMLFADQTDATNQKWTIMLGTAGLMASLLPGLGSAMKSYAGWAAGGASQLALAGKSLGTMALTAARIFGPIGLLAGGVALLIDYVSQLDKAKEAQQALNDSGEMWAAQLGYTFLENSPLNDAGTGDSSARGAEKIKELAEEGDEAAQALVDATARLNSSAEAMALALSEGIKVINSGGTTEQAQEAMRQVLELAADQVTLTPLELENLQLHIGEVDLEDPEQMQDAIQFSLDQALANTNVAEQTGSEAFQDWFGNISALDGIIGFAGDLFDVDVDQIRENAEDEWSRNITAYVGAVQEQFRTATSDFERNNMWDGLQESLSAQFQGELDQFNQAAGTMLDNNDLEALRIASVTGQLDEVGSAMGLNAQQLEAATSLAQNQGRRQQEILQQLIDSTEGLTDEEKERIHTLEDLQAATSATTASTATYQERYKSMIATASMGGKALSRDQQFALTQTMLLTTGLTAAQAAAQGLFGLSRSNLLEYLLRAKKEAIELANVGSVRGMNRAPERGVDRNPNSEKNLARRQRALDAQNEAIDANAEAREKAIQASGDATSDAIDKAGEAQQKAFDAQAKAEDKAFDERKDALSDYWDSVEKMTKDRQDSETATLKAAYDGRIAVIEEQIKAEEEAEARRQKIFEAEEKRIARIAARANRNIDFNAALNTGNFDEAAKLFNDAMADEQTWLTEDQKADVADASGERVKALREQIDSINEERDARLDALDKVQEAEREANKERRQATEEQLDLEKQVAKERLDAAREAAQEANKIAADSASKATENALESLRAQTEAAHASAQAAFDAESLSNAKRLADALATNDAIFSSEKMRLDRAAEDEKKKAIEIALYRKKRMIEGVEGALGGIHDRLDEALTSDKRRHAEAAWSQQTTMEAGAAAGRAGVLRHMTAMRDSNGILSRQTGERLDQEISAGGGRAKTNVVARAAEIQADMDTRWSRLGTNLGTQLNNGAISGREAVRARTEELINGPGSSMNAKFAWIGGQLAGHLGNGATDGGNRVRGIDWGGVGNEISGKIAGTVGLDTGGLTNWLRTGDYPGANWKKAMSRHEGGVILHGGGSPSWSSKDRTGIPRSAGLYPSEVPAVLKRGEFVVNEKATRANRGLLEQVNASSGAVQVPHGAAVKHNGGMWAPGALQAIGGVAAAELQANKTLTTIEELAQIRKAKEAAAAGGAVSGDFVAGAPGGGSGDGKFRTTNRNFPAPRQGVVSANTAAAKSFVQANFPGVGSIGTLGSRPNKSDHPMGKAIDNMIPNYKSPQGIALGNSIADYFIQNPNVFGTKYVIWRDRIAEDGGRGWQRYTHPNGPTNNDTLQHRDHPHVSFYHKGGKTDGFNLPQLNTGAFINYDNTLANLHKDESVLTAPLTAKFKEGLEGGLASGGATAYNVTIDLRGALIREDVDVENAVNRAIDKKEYVMGRRKVITG